MAVWKDASNVRPWRYEEIVWIVGEEDSVKNQDQEDTARFGRCFKALFGIPFGPGALLTFRSLMAS